jgi:hypothetical protein
VNTISRSKESEIMTKRIATGAVLFALAFAPAQRAAADGKDFALGIVTGVVGSAVVRDIRKRNQAQQTPVYSNPQYSTTSQYRTTSTRSSIPSAQREENRQVQTALNYFAFPAGSPDGVLGRRSRGAISEYQGYLGYPVTGQLAEDQRAFLVNSYYRAQSGGAATDQAIASKPDGVRGLLTEWRSASAGNATNSAAPAAATGAVPSFLAGSTAGMPLSSYCDKVGKRTTLNGGVTPAAGVTDANFALSEQFCLARGAAIAESNDLMAGVAGYTPKQIAEQCGGFGPLLKPYVALLGTTPETQVLNEVSAWAQDTGQRPEELAGTARVCLGTGYASDDMDLAIGSALILTALGDTGYAELAGHHLSQGFGAEKRPELARDWYDLALTAPERVFTVGGADRDAVIRKAAAVVSGRAEATEAGTLPTFSTAVRSASGATTAP